jgi:nucleotide-binding universal stress UspA family protein
MLRSIIVPLDGSAFAEQALPLALQLARRAPATLELVRVRAFLDEGEESARSYLARISHSISSQLGGAPLPSVVAYGPGSLQTALPFSSNVSEALARHAADRHAGLIVMTTHGRGGLRRAWLGSTADALMRTAPCPVLLLRPTDERFTSAAAADRGIRHIVIPLDGSEAAEAVLPSACDLGAPFRARFTLVHVVAHAAAPTVMEWSGPFAVGEEPLLAAEKAAAYLGGVAERMRLGGWDVATTVLFGTPTADTLAYYAASHAADLIAIATTGAGGVRRLFAGSVTDRLVRRGALSVLVTHAGGPHRALVEGASLHELMARPGPFPLARREAEDARW